MLRIIKTGPKKRIVAIGLVLFFCVVNVFSPPAWAMGSIKRIFKKNPSKKPPAVIPVNNPPQITSFFPADRTICVIGESLNFSINASDKDQDALMYRYLMDERVIGDWSNSSTYSFTPQFSDRGKHKIKVEVRDNRNGLDSKSVDIYIVRPFPKLLDIEKTRK